MREISRQFQNLLQKSIQLFTTPVTLGMVWS